MLLVQGSSRLGYLSARSPTAMMRLLRSPASISLRPTHAVSQWQSMRPGTVAVMQMLTGMTCMHWLSRRDHNEFAAFLELAVLGQVECCTSPKLSASSLYTCEAALQDDLHHIQACML